MKIIAKDSLSHETGADRLVADNIENQTEGEFMVRALNDRHVGNDYWYYMLVADDYVLWRGMEEFV